MAENKKSVLLYCDIIHTVEELSDEEAGKLFKHYLRYVNSLNPEPPDKLTQIVFEPIKQNLKRDLKKWEEKSGRNKTIAIEGWEKRKNANAYERTKQDSKYADKDIVKVIDTETVNVTDKVNVKVKKIKRESNFNFDFVDENFKESFFTFLDYRKKMHKEFKTQMSLEACYKNLLELSNRNWIIAAEVVKQSIENQWLGLFEIKEKNFAKKENGTIKGNTENRRESVANLKSLSSRILDSLSGENGTGSS